MSIAFLFGKYSYDPEYNKYLPLILGTFLIFFGILIIFGKISEFILYNFLILILSTLETHVEGKIC